MPSDAYRLPLFATLKRPDLASELLCLPAKVEPRKQKQRYVSLILVLTVSVHKAGLLGCVEEVLSFLSVPKFLESDLDPSEIFLIFVSECCFPVESLNRQPI